MSGQGSPSQWYVARDGQQHGPLSDAEMRLFVQGGHLKSSDLIWRPGFPDWKPAVEVFPPKQKNAQSKPAAKPADTGSPATALKAAAPAASKAADAAPAAQVVSAAKPEPKRETAPASQPTSKADSETSVTEKPQPVADASKAPEKKPVVVASASAAQSGPSISAKITATAPAKAQDSARPDSSGPVTARQDARDPSGQAVRAPKDRQPSTEPANAIAASAAKPAPNTAPASWPEMIGNAAAPAPRENRPLAAKEAAGSPRDPFDPDTWQQAEARQARSNVGAATAAPLARQTAEMHAASVTTARSPSADPRPHPTDRRQPQTGPEIAPQPRPMPPQRGAAPGPAMMPESAPNPLGRGGDGPAGPRVSAPAPRPGPTLNRPPADRAMAPPPAGYPSFENDLPAPIGRAPENRNTAPRISVPPQDARHHEHRTSMPPPDEGRAGLGRIAAVVTGLVVLSGLGYTGYTHRETIAGAVTDATQKLMAEKSPSSEGPPVIRVEPKAADRNKPFETAALDARTPEGIANDASGQARTPGIAPPGESTDPVAALDRQFAKSELWSVIKQEFPDWYDERLKEVAQMSKDRTETDVSAHLINRLVSLRRSNAQHALAASPEKLEAVAQAFLANLQSLTAFSTDACFRFISQGESSPAIVELIGKEPYGAAIERQIAAIFRAIADGKAKPNNRARAEKSDYDQLAGELGKLGWDQADLKLFADPTALSKAPPERVCKMVQDWFQAHIAIADKSVQERLLFETLRPVVAG